MKSSVQKVLFSVQLESTEEDVENGLTSIRHALLVKEIKS